MSSEDENKNARNKSTTTNTKKATDKKNMRMKTFC